jgi:hypothetical protein
VNEGILAVEEETEGLESERFEECVGEAGKFEGTGGSGRGRFDGGFELFGGAPFGLRDANRDNGGVVTGSEFALHAFDVFDGIENGMAGKVENSGEFALGGVYGEFHDRHGRNGTDIVRVENAEKRFGDFRKIVVDLEMKACGEKSEGLNEAFDVRVFAHVGAKNEARGDFGVLFGKVGAHLAQERELAFVIV